MSISILNFMHRMVSNTVSLGPYMTGTCMKTTSLFLALVCATLLGQEGHALEGPDLGVTLDQHFTLTTEQGDEFVNNCRILVKVVGQDIELCTLRLDSSLGLTQHVLVHDNLGLTLDIQSIAKGSAYGKSMKLKDDLNLLLVSRKEPVCVIAALGRSEYRIFTSMEVAVEFYAHHEVEIKPQQGKF